jgi:hypothetical protein
VFLDKLNPRDIRALKTGSVAVAAIVVLLLVLNWFEGWAQIRKTIADKRLLLAKLSDLGTDKMPADVTAVMSVIEVPQKEEKQQFLFRDEFNKQLKQAGVQAKPLKFMPLAKAPDLRYKLLSIQCSGKCNLDQLLNLLAALKKNPYLAGIEQLSINKADAKNPQSREVNIEMRVSTFVR